MTTPSTKPGDVLAGKYRVERVLGSGGMGYVVAARHMQLDQMVAMKFLRKNAVEGSEASRRFLREAKAVVKLRNEHIAKVYDVGTLEAGEPYIVMEYLDGMDLSALVKQRGTLQPSEAVEYVIQACEALAEAHSLGIIHRDIKLANLFVTRGPSGGPLVKVLDFGISKTNPFGESEHDMTRTSSMLGSPRFMSPEQMRDPRAVDGRSDIWSLGVVLYRLVSGRAPFEADTLGRLLSMVMHEPEPPLATLRPDLPPGFDQIVGRCMQKDPTARFANVAELAVALVPYALDPARARAAAERIAAVQSVPITASLDRSNPFALSNSQPSQFPSNRQSVAPGGTDGTNASWAGTQNARSSSWTTMFLGIALAALLVGAGVFAFKRHQRNATLPPATAAVTAPTETALPATPPTPAPPPPVGAGTVIGVSTPVTADPPVAPTPTEEPPAPRRPVTGTAPPTRTKGPSRPVSSGAPAAPKNEDGIPATRD